MEELGGLASCEKVGCFWWLGAGLRGLGGLEFPEMVNAFCIRLGEPKGKPLSF